MNILEKITNELDILSKSERKVAEVILASPSTVIHSSIAALAKQANISEPTVNRFCRRLDTTAHRRYKSWAGFQQFHILVGCKLCTEAHSPAFRFRYANYQKACRRQRTRRPRPAPACSRSGPQPGPARRARCARGTARGTSC